MTPLPPWSPEVVPLTADEAVEAITLGDHPGAANGTLRIDATLIELIRRGDVEAGRGPDGMLYLRASEQLIRELGKG